MIDIVLAIRGNAFERLAQRLVHVLHGRVDGLRLPATVVLAIAGIAVELARYLLAIPRLARFDLLQRLPIEVRPMSRGGRHVSFRRMIRLRFSGRRAHVRPFLIVGSLGCVVGERIGRLERSGVRFTARLLAYIRTQRTSNGQQPEKIKLSVCMQSNPCIER